MVLSYGIKMGLDYGIRETSNLVYDIIVTPNLYLDAYWRLDRGGIRLVMTDTEWKHENDEKWENVFQLTRLTLVLS